MKDLSFEAYEKLTDFIDNYQDGSGYHIEFRLSCHSCMNCFILCKYSNKRIFTILLKLMYLMNIIQFSGKETKRDRKLKKDIERNIYEVDSSRKYRDGTPASSVITGAPLGNYSDEKTFKILCYLIAIMNQYFPDYDYR